MTITERIAAAIKHILDEDRRADRERIAELERTIGFLNLRVSNEEERANNWQAMVADLNKQLDELTEKCAALVLEKELARGELVKLREARDATPLRIDPDMSDPQQGKLLVVRLDADDVGRAWVPLGEMSDRGRETQNFWPEQRVGFLVETPAVEVKEQGPWVVYDVDEPNWRMRDAWVYTIKGEGFDSKEEAQKIIDDFGCGSKKMRVITLAEARAIEAGKTPAVEVKRTPKVGDRVRIIARNGLVKYGDVGEIGTVAQVDNDNTAWVAGVGHDGPWCHLLSNLEVIE